LKNTSHTVPDKSLAKTLVIGTRRTSKDQDSCVSVLWKCYVWREITYWCSTII